MYAIMYASASIDNLAKLLQIENPILGYPTCPSTAQEPSPNHNWNDGKVPHRCKNRVAAGTLDPHVLQALGAIVRAHEQRDATRVVFELRTLAGLTHCSYHKTEDRINETIEHWKALL
jgi:hypothetical protein